MTRDEALGKAARELDGLLQQRWDRLYLRLLEDGIDPDDSWIFAVQQNVDRDWKALVLADIRQQLES